MTWYIRIRQFRDATRAAIVVLVGWLYTNAFQISAAAGVALVGIGVGLHDLGAGMAVAGLLMIGLVVFSVLLPRLLKDC